MLNLLSEIDLGKIFAPLPKQQLELLLVKMISAHPEVGDEVIELALAPVNCQELQEQICEIVESGEEIMTVLDSLSSFVDSANAFIEVHRMPTWDSSSCTLLGERLEKRSSYRRDVDHCCSWKFTSCRG